jgi:crossover junction endodeoxyribonuclease RuvC
LALAGDIILGIDPGSLRTGFGLIRRFDGQLLHIAHGTIVLDNKKIIAERLKDLAHDLTTIITKYRPTQAVIEDVFLFNNPRSALVLGQARGAALAVLGLHGLVAHSLSPTRVKSLVAGRGRADKFQVAHLVSLELKIAIPESQDSSDALALALAHGYLK